MPPVTPPSTAPQLKIFKPVSGHSLIRRFSVDKFAILDPGYSLKDCEIYTVVISNNGPALEGSLIICLTERIRPIVLDENHFSLIPFDDIQAVIE